MLILPVGVLSGLALGRMRGGRLGGLAELRFRSLAVLWLAVAIQLGLGVVPAAGRQVAVELSYALVGAWLVLNARPGDGAVRAGMALLALGWLLNMVPITLNGGMPVSRQALWEVGAPASTAVAEGHLFKHLPADRRTAAPALGDVIPVPAAASVISIGDVVMLVGVAGVLAAGMTRERAGGGPAGLAVSSGRGTSG
jgi:hypothetical protein